jgi:hypothetical protein
MDPETDRRIRMAAFARLEELQLSLGEVLPRAALASGFTFEGQRMPFLSQQGILKP